MNYRFQKRESPGMSARRIQLEELDCARSELVTAVADPDALHEVRKRIKRLRALLRLCRDGMVSVVEVHDDTLRDIGRLLAAHREADVLVGILRAEAVAAGSADVPLLEETVRLHQTARAPLRQREADLARARRMLGGLRRRVAQLAIDSLEPGDCLRRVRKAYRRACRQWWTAVSEATDESLHEWRKRTKILLNQLRLLRAWGGSELPGVRNNLARIDDHLGRARDFAHLAGILRGVPLAEIPLRYGHGLRRRLELAVDDELSRAFEIGRRAFRSRPKQFVRRMFK